LVPEKYRLPASGAAQTVAVVIGIVFLERLGHSAAGTLPGLPRQAPSPAGSATA